MSKQNNVEKYYHFLSKKDGMEYIFAVNGFLKNIDSFTQLRGWYRWSFNSNWLYADGESVVLHWPYEKSRRKSLKKITRENAFAIML